MVSETLALVLASVVLVFAWLIWLTRRDGRPVEIKFSLMGASASVKVAGKSGTQVEANKQE